MELEARIDAALLDMSGDIDALLLDLELLSKVKPAAAFLKAVETLKTLAANSNGDLEITEFTLQSVLKAHMSARKLFVQQADGEDAQSVKTAIQELEAIEEAISKSMNDALDTLANNATYTSHTILRDARDTMALYDQSYPTYWDAAFLGDISEKYTAAKDMVELKSAVRIGTEYYYRLDTDVYNAVTEGCTVEVLHSHTRELSKAFTTTVAYTLDIAKGVLMDHIKLSGGTCTLTGEGQMKALSITTSDTTLVIKGGEGFQIGTLNTVDNIDAAPSVTVVSGTIETYRLSSNGGILDMRGGHITKGLSIFGGTTTITGGEIDGTITISLKDTTSSFRMTGGTMLSSPTFGGVSTSATASITGGTFANTIEYETTGANAIGYPVVIGAGVELNKDQVFDEIVQLADGCTALEVQTSDESSARLATFDSASALADAFAAYPTVCLAGGTTFGDTDTDFTIPKGKTLVVDNDAKLEAKTLTVNGTLVVGSTGMAEYASLLNNGQLILLGERPYDVLESIEGALFTSSQGASVIIAGEEYLRGILELDDGKTLSIIIQSEGVYCISQSGRLVSVLPDGVMLFGVEDGETVTVATTVSLPDATIGNIVYEDIELFLAAFDKLIAYDASSQEKFIPRPSLKAASYTDCVDAWRKLHAINATRKDNSFTLRSSLDPSYTLTVQNAKLALNNACHNVALDYLHAYSSFAFEDGVVLLYNATDSTTVSLRFTDHAKDTLDVPFYTATNSDTPTAVFDNFCQYALAVHLISGDFSTLLDPNLQPPLPLSATFKYNARLGTIVATIQPSSMAADPVSLTAVLSPQRWDGDKRTAKTTVRYINTSSVDDLTEAVLISGMTQTLDMASIANKSATTYSMPNQLEMCIAANGVLYDSVYVPASLHGASFFDGYQLPQNITITSVEPATGTKLASSGVTFERYEDGNGNLNYVVNVPTNIAKGTYSGALVVTWTNSDDTAPAAPHTLTTKQKFTLTVKATALKLNTVTAKIANNFFDKVSEISGNVYNYYIYNFNVSSPQIKYIWDIRVVDDEGKNDPAYDVSFYQSSKKMSLFIKNAVPLASNTTIYKNLRVGYISESGYATTVFPKALKIVVGKATPPAIKFKESSVNLLVDTDTNDNVQPTTRITLKAYPNADRIKELGIDPQYKLSAKYDNASKTITLANTGHTEATRKAMTVPIKFLFNGASDDRSLTLNIKVNIINKAKSVKFGKIDSILAGDPKTRYVDIISDPTDFAQLLTNEKATVNGSTITEWNALKALFTFDIMTNGQLRIKPVPGAALKAGSYSFTFRFEGYEDAKGKQKTVKLTVKAVDKPYAIEI